MHGTAKGGNVLDHDSSCLTAKRSSAFLLEGSLSTVPSRAPCRDSTRSLRSLRCFRGAASSMPPFGTSRRSVIRSSGDGGCRQRSPPFGSAPVRLSFVLPPPHRVHDSCP